MATDFLGLLGGGGDEDVLRRFLSSRGRLRPEETTAADTADVQRQLAARQLTPPPAEDDMLASFMAAQAGKVAPAAPAAPARDADYDARRAAASRTAFVNDTLGGLTEGFDRATNFIVGPRGAQPIRTRNAGAVEDAERRFLGQEAEREKRALAERNRPVVEAERAAALEKLKADTAKAKATTASTVADADYEAALRDVNSPETQAMREYAVSLSNGKLSPALAAGMNGIQLRDGAKLATSQLNAEAMAGIQQQRLTQSAKEFSAQNALGIRALELQIEALETRNENARLDREQEKELAELKAELERKRIAAASENAGNKRALTMAEREVGGFRIKPGAVPSADSAKKVRDVSVEERKVLYSLQKIEDLYAKHGTQVYGKYAGEMGAEFIAITNALRVINDMGVPNGRDYEMLEKEFADPTTWKDVFTSRARTQVKFEALRQRIRNTTNATADASGYERDGGMPRVAPSGSMVQVDDLPPGPNAPTAQTPAPAPRPVTKPAISSGEEVPRLISTKGLKAGQLKDMLEEGETVRIPWKFDDGTTGYRTLRKVTKDGKTKLVVMKEER